MQTIRVPGHRAAAVARVTGADESTLPPLALRGHPNMTRMTASLTLGALLTIATLLAADVSGTWTGDVPRRNGGADRNTFEFRLDGNKLSGTVTTPTATYPIENGVVDGDEIRFAITVNMGSNVKFAYIGKVDGDEIGFTRVIDSMGIVVSFLATRQR